MVVDAEQLERRVRVLENRQNRRIHTYSVAQGFVDSASGSAGVTDHGALTGLGDDDHTQYLLLAGRAGGQTAIGGTAASERLQLQSTAHATRGSVRVLDTLLEVNGDATSADEDPRVTLSGGNGAAVMVTSIEQDSSAGVTYLRQVTGGAQVANVWAIGPDTTSDRDCLVYFMGGDGSGGTPHRTRVGLDYDASSDFFDIYFQEEAGGAYDVTSTHNVRIGFARDDRTVHTSTLTLYAADGTNSRSSIITGGGSGIAITFSHTSMGFSVAAGGDIDLSSSTGSVNLTAALNLNFNALNYTFAATGSGGFINTITDNISPAWNVRQSTNEYFRANTSNNSERAIAGNTGQANMAVLLRHGTSGWVGIENSTRDARIVLTGNALLLNDQTDVAPQMTNLTTTQRDALTGATGMIIYNSDNADLESYIGSAWRSVGVNGPFIKTNVLSPTQLTGDQNNYAPTGHAQATTLLIDVDASNRALTGLAGGVVGRFVLIANITTGASTLSLNHEDTNSSAANRFFCPGAAAHVINPDESVWVYYVTVGGNSRWRVVAP